MARQLAYCLGLDKQMILGMFCAIANLSISTTDEDESIEELWNGNQKLFLPPETKTSNSSMTTSNTFDDFFESESYESSEDGSSIEETASAVVGIVQPF